MGVSIAMLLSLRTITAQLVIAACLLGGCISVSHSQSIGTEGTIYDPKLIERMTFSEAQRPQVRGILEKSEQAIRKVFAQHGIDPRERPDFDKLHAASQELQSIEAREKKAMKSILSKEQYADYLEILQATAAAVIKATRND